MVREAEEGKDRWGSSQSVEGGGNYWTMFIIYTTPHLHQLIEEHKSASSSIGQHFRVKHSSDLSNNFRILKKCKSKINLTAWCLTQFVQKFLNSSFN